MPIKVILGLPYLSNGPLLAKARELGAPILVSANSFSRWRDEGPIPEGRSFGRHLAPDIDPAGPFPHGRKKRMRSWAGWNTSSLKNADGTEAWLDSAGFVAMNLTNGFLWSPEEYIFGLCAAYPWARFSSLDQCVEPEIAPNRFIVEERISKTINLNKTCQMLANDIGIGDRLMPVIQGANADDYLRCFDALEGMIGNERIIGVGSMCRRAVGGDDGIVSIVDALHRRLPRGIRLHLFGLKSDGAECVADLDGRVASIDSQAYGFRARAIANERRKDDPSFSKTNVFVAEVMEKWYRGQVSRMTNPRPRAVQSSLNFGSGDNQSKQPNAWHAYEVRARAQINQLIEEMQLDADEIVSDAMVLAWMSDMSDDDDLLLAA